MDKQALPPLVTEKTELHRAEGILWRSKFQSLANSPVQEKLELKSIQEAALEVNAEEDHIEEVVKPAHSTPGKQPPVASFAREGLYSLNNGCVAGAYIFS